MSEKQDIERKVEEKEIQLFQAEQESAAWNKGKYKENSNAPMSKIYVESIREELNELRSRLEKL